MKSYALVVALCCLAFSTPSHAQSRAYIWTDEKGVAHVTDKAPPPDVQAEVIQRDGKTRMETHTRSKPEGDYDRRQSEAMHRIDMMLKADDAKKEAAAARARAEANDKKTRTEVKQKRLERAEDEYQRMKVSEDRYKWLQNNAYYEDDRLFYKEQLERMDLQRKKVEALKQ